VTTISQAKVTLLQELYKKMYLENTQKREMVDHSQYHYRDEKCGNNRSW
jgi:hypothetical protein